MKKLLIIALLVVGCAPTTATFYIGMPIEEFVDNNPQICKDIDEFDTNRDNGGFIIDKIDDRSDWRYTIDYLFSFEDDTLVAVYRGVLNAFIKKDIDYSKYPGSLPEWFAG